MKHFFGDHAYSLEAENPAPADTTCPQVPGARYNPVAIAEPSRSVAEKPAETPAEKPAKKAAHKKAAPRKR